MRDRDGGVGEGFSCPKWDNWGRSGVQTRTAAGASGVSNETPAGGSGVRNRTPESRSTGRSVAPEPGSGWLVGVPVGIRRATEVPILIILLGRDGRSRLGTGGRMHADPVRPVLRLLIACLDADGVGAALGYPEFLEPRNTRRGRTTGPTSVSSL